MKKESEEQKKIFLAEIIRRLKEEKYRFYEPSGKGEEFIKEFATLSEDKSRIENFIVLYSAANAVGKTATGTNILAHLFWPTKENHFFNFGAFNDWPYLKRGRIVSDPTNISKNIIPELKKWFPKGRYTARKAGKQFESVWETDTGWEFDVMTYEQDPREFEGATLGWAWFDEPPSEAIFKATIARMRKGGIIFITATPLAGSAYLYDSFAKGEYEVEIITKEGEAPKKHKRKIGYVEADIESACKIHGIRGHLDHEAIEDIIAEYSEDEKQARIYGKFQHLIGMVFKRFSRKIHVIDPFHINKSDFVVWEMIDPHPRTEDAVLWVAIDKNGTKYVVDELFITPNDDEDLAVRIKEKGDRFRVIRRIADPSAFNTDQHSKDNKSLSDRLSDYGLTYEKATKDRAGADRRIEDALNYTEANDRMLRHPELYFFSTCRRSIWEMEHYQWDDWRGRTGEDKNKKQRPKDKDDHMIENLGRCLYQEPMFHHWVVERDVYSENTNDLDPYEDLGSSYDSSDPYEKWNDGRY